MTGPEPGLDLSEWQAEMAALEEELRDDPRGALPELARLVRRMLEERGYDLDDPVVLEGEERDVVAEFLAAQETVDLLERGEAGPGDVAQAIEGLRAIYDFVVSELAPP